MLDTKGWTFLTTESLLETEFYSRGQNYSLPIGMKYIANALATQMVKQKPGLHKLTVPLNLVS